MSQSILIRGISLLTLMVVIGAYARLGYIANLNRPGEWIPMTALFAGPYILMALAVATVRNIDVIAIAWALIGLNFLGYMLGGFTIANETGLVMLPILLIAWPVGLFGFLLILTPLIDKLSPKTSTRETETANTEHVHDSKRQWKDD